MVAIIGILAAIAIPQYQDYITRAAENACESELAALRTPVAIADAAEETIPTYSGTACRSVNVDLTNNEITGQPTRDGTADGDIGTSQSITIYSADATAGEL